MIGAIAVRFRSGAHGADIEAAQAEASSPSWCDTVNILPRDAPLQ